MNIPSELIFNSSLAISRPRRGPSCYMLKMLEKYCKKCDQSARWLFCRPYGAPLLISHDPTACAVGCILAPLRGLDRISFTTVGATATWYIGSWI